MVKEDSSATSHRAVADPDGRRRAREFWNRSRAVWPDTSRRLSELGATVIGVATEIFDSQPADLSDKIDEARAWSSQALEISALTIDDLHRATSILDAGRLPFGRVTIHSPLDIPAGREQVVADALTSVSSRLDGIVIHPQAITDPGPFRPLGALVLVENMDCSKDSARTATELRPCFRRLPEARLCLDIAHAWTIDASLAAARELLDTYHDRLGQVHVSGIDRHGAHEPLASRHIDQYAPVLRQCGYLPWLVESAPC